MASTQIHITPQGLKKFFKITGFIILIFLALTFWYIAVPVVVVWYLYRKNKIFSPKVKLISSISVAGIFLLMGVMNAHSNREPVLILNEPQNGISIQAERITVKGTVNPKKAVVTVNEIPMEVDSEGNFSYNARLRNENNNLTIQAKNGGRVVAQTVNVKRIFTEEELAEIERIKEEENRIKLEKEAEEKAKIDAYHRTPAGKICKDNPTWTESDCEKLAKGYVWIGMSIDMLKYKRGLPESVNTSNYGRGNEYQWCWGYKYDPSCFYGGSDGIVDSYN